MLSLSVALFALLAGAVYSLKPDYAKTTTTLTCTPWNDTTIGSATGSAIYDDCQMDTVSISSDGFVSVFTTADSQHVVYQTLCGNGEITARVFGMAPSQSGFAGVFIRESLAPGARKAAILTQLNNQIIRQHRLTTNYYQTHAVVAN